ncbi:MAG: M1 family metallopeptidase [Acidobacteriia bacterium]|nr:M1 family metallopeptidase [Terriglobia bacterium]
MKRTIGYVFLFLLPALASAQRLPETAVPDNYHLTLTPDLAKATFAGDETITIRVLKPTTQIVLNAVDLDFQEASISSGGAIQKAAVTFEKSKEQVTLDAGNLIQPGPATIHIKYTGILNSEMRGFYLGKDDQGRKYASTQFEPTDARRAYPSFDEPAYKATFEITLIADKGLTAISNNSVVSDATGPDADKHTVKFAKTARISSYLAAWVVGQFEYVEGAVDGIPIRVYSTPGKKELSAFALETAEFALHYYNHYFGIKYPYGKLDLIGLPDFSSGAMENVGLITSRAVLLQLDEQKASLALKKTVAVVITHEIAHQWLGDLVTMQWWDDVWLNEGMATWMEGKPVDAWKPEWNVGLDEVCRGDILTTLGALSVDSLASTRSIHQSAETPQQILELFDGVAYGKTAAVLRMLEAYLGPDSFRAGMNAYLKQYAYRNSTADDFWSTLQKVSNKPVDKIMQTFVKQPGVPMINIKAEASGDSTKVTLRQQRYFYDRTLFSEGGDQLWQIPVCLKPASLGGGGSGRQQCELLTKKVDTFTLPGHSPWVLANAGATGYYHSGYETAAVRGLAHDAETALTPVERLFALTDTWAAVRVGRQPVGDLLTLAEGLQTDRVGAVITLLFGYLNYIGDNLINDTGQPDYQAWVRRFVTPIANDVGWQAQPGESDERKDLRSNVLAVLGGPGRDPRALAEARKLTDQALKDPASVESSLAAAAFSLVARNGDAAFYDKLLAALKAAKTPEQYYLYLFTLSNFSDPQLVERTLQYAISSEVRSQDSLNLIGAIMSKPVGRRPAWDFVRTHWAEVEKAGGPFASAQIEGNTGTFCDAKLRDEVVEFFSAHKVAAGERTLKQSLEQINNCIDLKSLQSEQLASWLGSRSEGGR